MEEGKRPDQNYVGPEHILLGILREGQGLAARVLNGLGVDADDVSEELVELLGPDFQPLRERHHDSLWHSVQACWMCMREALRIGDRDMFVDVMGMGRKLLERGYASYESIDINASIDKLPRWGPLSDYMLFCLQAIEHTHAPWAIHWFDKFFNFAYQRPDRFEQYDLLHQPRRLFYTIHILDRMIERKGRVSNFLEG